MSVDELTRLVMDDPTLPPGLPPIVAPRTRLLWWHGALAMLFAVIMLVIANVAVAVVVLVAMLIAQEAAGRVAAVRQRQAERRERDRLQALARLAQLLSAAITPEQISDAVVRQVLNDAGAQVDVLARSAYLRYREALGEDIGRLIHEGPKEQLDLTTNTQPVMLAAAVACYRAWMAETGRAPAVVAGHSLGEYSALVAAGSLTLADALPLVRLRAQAMQEAVPVGAGAMAAILGLDADVVRSVCAEVAAAVGEPVSAANYNDPKQTVIAGSKAAVDQACEALKGRGAKRALPLPVSAPFHSSLMKPAAERLRERLGLHAVARDVLDDLAQLQLCFAPGALQAFGEVLVVLDLLLDSRDLAADAVDLALHRVEVVGGRDLAVAVLLEVRFHLALLRHELLDLQVDRLQRFDLRLELAA